MRSVRFKDGSELLPRGGARDPSCTDPGLLLAIGAIICPGLANSPMATVADIHMRLESPHVYRLRQLFIRVGDRLGDEARRFRPIPICTQKLDPACPFAARPAANAA